MQDLTSAANFPQVGEFLFLTFADSVFHSHLDFLGLR